MSEERGTYMGETTEDHVYEIRDEAAPRDYFAQIPNLVDIMDLSPHAYRLYGHLRKVAGESGRCWQSTKTLAKSCDMSMGKISESKQELESIYPPLIRIESKPFDRGQYHEIAITDIWEINHLFWTGAEITIKTAKGAVFHNMNEWRSQYELLRSQYETKKNPVKEEPRTGDKSPLKTDELSIEWKIAAGVEGVTITDDTQARRIDMANLIATGTGSKARDIYALVMAFQDTRGIIFSQSEVKGQRKQARYLLEKGVNAEHVRMAVHQLMKIKYTCVDLFSIQSNAVDLATKPQAEIEYTRLL